MCRTTEHHILEDHDLSIHYSENLKSLTVCCLIIILNILAAVMLYAAYWEYLPYAITGCNYFRET